MKKILFVLVFAANFLTAQNWFPLEVGNKWQFFGSTYFQGATLWWIKNCIIDSVTIINGLKYFRYCGRLFRNDTVDQKLYTYGFNADSNKYTEGLFMDFNLSNGTSFVQFDPGSVFYHHRLVTVVETNSTFLGKTWNVKAYNWNSFPYFESGYWALNFGYFDSTPIQAQFKLNDSLLTYDHGQYPVISFNPITQISTNSFSAKFSVRHYYSRWYEGPGAFTYIESVILMGFYEKGDSIYNFSPVSTTVGYDYQCTLNFLLDLELLKRQYTFKYKIQAKDKGLLPHYTTVPDTGYYSLVYVDSLTNIHDNDNKPYNFTLSQNYPNPFNPSTKIKYAISSPQYATLKVYDVLGNEVATLVDEYKLSGNYEVEFDGTNLTSGIYFYQLNTGNFIETKKMILLR